MKQKIVVLDTGYPSYEREKKLFEEQGWDFKVFEGARDAVKQKIRLAREATGIMVRWTRIDEAFLEQLPQLKAVVRYGTGYDNIDLEAASAHHIKVANVSGYANHSVSDHALAMIYANARALFPGNNNLLASFGMAPVPRVFELQTKTLGIIGLGRIGSTLAKKANPLFKHVLAYDPYIPKEQFDEAGATQTELEKLLFKSDVISIHCNLTEETNNMINKETFYQMKHQPILVNTARGDIVNGGDLLNALNSKQIHSAGIDVFNEEPPSELQADLLAHPRIITTGHYAWYSERSIKILQETAAQHMIKLLNGVIPDDCLNPDA